jgi:hypothetical protein
LGISDKKNNSAEDGIDGTNGYFRWNSGCSAEQKISEFRSEPFRRRENNSEFRSVEPNKKQTLGIPFQILQRKRKQPGIPFRGTKVEANSRNSAPNHSAEEKTSQSKTRQPKISKIVSEKMTFEVRTNHFFKVNLPVL